MSHGAIQMMSPGLRSHNCEEVTSYPGDLSPAPPENSNFAVICSSYSLAGRTGQILTVGSRSQGSAVTQELYVNYPLDADGRPGNSIDVSWITPLAFLGYLVLAQHRFRKTIGLRMMRSQMIWTDDATAERIPFTRLAVRYAVLFAGYIPAIAVIGYTAVTVLNGSAATETLIGGMGIGWLLGMIWWLWNVILIARKRDPIYDRVARTAIVRIEKPAAASP